MGSFIVILAVVIFAFVIVNLSFAYAKQIKEGKTFKAILLAVAIFISVVGTGVALMEFYQIRATEYQENK